MSYTQALPGRLLHQADSQYLARAADAAHSMKGPLYMYVYGGAPPTSPEDLGSPPD